MELLILLGCLISAFRDERKEGEYGDAAQEDWIVRKRHILVHIADTFTPCSVQKLLFRRESARECPSNVELFSDQLP